MEYAIEAIKLGSTALGICTSEGVVLAVEKRITSPLLELTTIEKIVEVDKHIGKWIVYLVIRGTVHVKTTYINENPPIEHISVPSSMNR